MNLEHELQQALKRKSPSRGFDQRVLARLASGHSSRMPDRQSPWLRRALTLAASLALVVGGTSYLRQQQRQEQQAETERAARDVVLALQIASEKVSAVQLKVQEINQHERQIPQ
jgi:hypothetical protein